MAIPVEGKIIEAHITYLDKDDGNTIKVFAQPSTSTNYARYVEKVLYHIRGLFEDQNLNPQTVQEIEMGKTCCAKFEDGIYYRARVVTMEKLRAERVVGVHFIDHGNTANVKINDIVILSRVKEVVPEDLKQGVVTLIQTPPLAEEYLLHGCNPPDGRGWDDMSLGALRVKHCNTDVKCKVYEFSGRKIMQILMIQSDQTLLKSSLNRDPSLTRAVDVNHSQFSKLDQARLRPNLSMPPPIHSMQSALPTNRFPNLSQPPPGVRMVSDTNLSLSQSSNKPGVLTTAPRMAMKHNTITTASTSVQSLQFSSEMLAPGVAHQVFVSHVEDGPCAFAVQIQVGLGTAEPIYVIVL